MKHLKLTLITFLLGVMASGPLAGQGAPLISIVYEDKDYFNLCESIDMPGGDKPLAIVDFTYALHIYPTYSVRTNEAYRLRSSAEGQSIALLPSLVFKDYRGKKVWQHHLLHARREAEQKALAPNLPGRWQIDEAERKEILGISCQLAVLQTPGCQLRAWFTPDIPFPDGATVQTTGLPGLTLKLEVGTGGKGYEAVRLLLSSPEPLPLPNFTPSGLSGSEAALQARQDDQTPKIDGSTVVGQWLPMPTLLDRFEE